jgi:RNA polymerase sigma-70 factor (ECF subfamily)
VTAIPAPSSLPPSDAEFEAETLRFLADVMRFARSLVRDAADAEDLVQETYLRAYRSRHTFQPGASTRQWLFTICRNCWLRSREREQRIVQVEDDAALETLAAVALHREAKRDGAEDLFDRLDFAPAFERALAALPEPYREVFVLVDVGDGAYADVATALGLPVGTVRSRLFRARRELQHTLLEHARDRGIVPPAKSEKIL